MLPDVQTFFGLMEYLAAAGDLKGVHRLMRAGVAMLALRVFDKIRVAWAERKRWRRREQGQERHLTLVC